ncbi:hypothetical protein M0G74_08025 [Microbulbifer sp. CAU 1566]|uniref:hypothetical protein n=1 Tax=Microbulbifer sp. CAU 1566 TaxID=2933269 RepID=UPI0020039A3B|nr:hypothetical protein [Microbulbifer sp. CAU 1566]MCK7597219.1 hypothetical protein [Microbulbifer sp. CAU 1566]
MHEKWKAIGFAVLVFAHVGLVAQEDLESSASVVQKTQVTLDGSVIYINSAGDVFEIHGPGGFSYTSDNPYFDFEGDIPDGVYSFQVYSKAGVQSVVVPEARNTENGRQPDSVPGQVLQKVVSGTFQVTDNHISTVNQ